MPSVSRVLKIDNDEIEVPVPILQLNETLNSMLTAFPNSKVIGIKNCDAVSFRTYIHYLSTGRVRNVTANLLLTACKFKEHRLMKKCASHLIKHITLENVLSLIEAGHTCQCRKLVIKATRFVLQNQPLSLEFHELIAQFIERNKDAAMVLLMALYRAIASRSMPNFCHFSEMDEWIKDPQLDKCNYVVIGGRSWMVVLFRTRIRRHYHLCVRLTPCFDDHFTVDVEVVVKPSRLSSNSFDDDLTVVSENCIFDDKFRTVEQSIMKFDDFEQQYESYVYLDDLLVGVNIQPLEREE